MMLPLLARPKTETDGLPAPRMRYSLAANPTPVQISKDVTFQLSVSNPEQREVTISELRFMLPSQGTAATDLSNNLTRIPTTKPDGWTVRQDKSTFVITPDNTASGTLESGGLGLQGLIFTFGPIPVNDNAGTAKVNVVEKIDNVTSDKLPFDVSKWPVEFSFSNFTASKSCVEPGSTVQLNWNVTGDATLTLNYPGSAPVVNPPCPYTTAPIVTTTTFTLTADSSVNGNPVSVTLQNTVEIDTPVLVTRTALFDIVYQGQDNALYWSTHQADHCVIKANGVTLSDNAPATTTAAGFPIPASNLKGRTTMEIAPFKGSKAGQAQQWDIFAKTLVLQSPLGGNAGWGAVAVDQNGQYAYVCNTSNNTLVKVSMADGKPEGSVKVGLGPRGVSITPDGERALVSNAFDESLSVVSLDTLDVIGTINNIASPAGLSIIGTTAYVASMGASPQVMVVNLDDHTVADTIPSEGSPIDVAINPNGKTFYVADLSSPHVNVYDVATKAKTHSIDVKSNPTTVAMSANGASVYVGSRTGSVITVLDAHADVPCITTTADAHSAPVNLGVSGRGQYVAMVGLSTFFVLELALPTT